MHVFEPKPHSDGQNKQCLLITDISSIFKFLLDCMQVCLTIKILCWGFLLAW
jgi:hypothetical protein